MFSEVLLKVKLLAAINTSNFSKRRACVTYESSLVICEILLVCEVQMKVGKVGLSHDRTQEKARLLGFVAIFPQPMTGKERTVNASRKLSAGLRERGETVTNKVLQSVVLVRGGDCAGG